MSEVPRLFVLDIVDRGNAFRMIAIGRLADAAVAELAQKWSAALAEPSLRRITLDISRISGYDAAGRRLLREIHAHGTEFAASTPESLTFLAEITAPKRRNVPVVLEPVARPKRPGSADPKHIVLRTAASQ